METIEYGYGITAEVSDNGCIAIVKRNGKVLKRFKKETAHTDSVRFAHDLVMKEIYN